jgi:hypothetical protein
MPRVDLTTVYSTSAGYRSREDSVCDSREALVPKVDSRIVPRSIDVLRRVALTAALGRKPARRVYTQQRIVEHRIYAALRGRTDRGGGRAACDAADVHGLVAQMGRDGQ